MENTIVKLLTTCKSYNYNRIKKGKIMIEKFWNFIRNENNR